MVSSTTEVEALLWSRTLHLGAFFIPIFFLHFILELIDGIKEKKRLIIIGYLYCGVLFIMLPSNLFISNVNIDKVGFKYFLKPGVAYHLFSIYFFSAIVYGLYECYRGLKISTGFKKNQIKYVFFACCIGYTGGATAFFPLFDISMPSWSLYSILLYTCIITYAIIKYRLLDINLVIRDTTVHLISSFILAVPAITLVVLFREIPIIIGIFILFALMLPLFYTPLKKFLKPVIEKSMFGDKYEYLYTLGTVSNQWFAILSLHKFLERMVNDIAHAMRLKYCSFILFNEDGGYYEMGASTGIGQEIDIKHFRLGADDPLISYLNQKKSIIVKEELKVDPCLIADEQVPILKEMGQLSAEICIPFTIDNQLRGVLNIGAKPDSEMYNQDDLEILNWLVEQGKVMFSYTIHNYKQLQLVSQYAHDLGNPLGNAKAYFLLLDESLKDEESRKNFAAMRKNINFVDECVQDMRESSRIDYEQITKQIKTEEIDLENLVGGLVQSLDGFVKEKNISLICNLENGLPKKVYADRNRLERLIRNMVQNSLKFTEEGKIDIKISQENKNLKIIIADTGKGISKENLPKIFDPFFKTKDSGIVGGMGLGLNMVKKIVELYKGKIWVESELGKGTSFTILMPILGKPVLT